MFIPKPTPHQERLVRCRVCHYGPSRRRHMVKHIDGPIDLWFCTVECRDAWYILRYTEPYQTIFKQGVGERTRKLSKEEAYEAAGTNTC